MRNERSSAGRHALPSGLFGLGGAFAQQRRHRPPMPKAATRRRLARGRECGSCAVSLGRFAGSG
jgi:hypothetical protein